MTLCWAKNCREERDAPTQIIFGAADWCYCVFSLLAVWLEARSEEYPDSDSEVVLDAGNSQCPIAIKESVSTHLSQLMSITAVQNLVGCRRLRQHRDPQHPQVRRDLCAHVRILKGRG